MADKKTLTLNLTDAEMDVLDDICRKKELSKTAVLKQALRFYQLVNARLEAGEKLYFENDELKKKAEFTFL